MRTGLGFARLITFAAIAACLAAGCGGAAGTASRSSADFPRKFAAEGELQAGFRAYLQSDKDVNIEREPIRLKCALKNCTNRKLYLDSTAGWALGVIEVEKEGAEAPKAATKRASVNRGYSLVEPGKVGFWFIENLDTELWRIPPLEPGSYTLRLFYDGSKAKESKVWDRLSSAGGKYEGGELWTAKVASNPVSIRVKSLSEALGKK